MDRRCVRGQGWEPGLAGPGGNTSPKPLGPAFPVRQEWKHTLASGVQIRETSFIVTAAAPVAWSPLPALAGPQTAWARAAVVCVAGGEKGLQRSRPGQAQSMARGPRPCPQPPAATGSCAVLRAAGMASAPASWKSEFAGPRPPSLRPSVKAGVFALGFQTCCFVVITERNLPLLSDPQTTVKVGSPVEGHGCPDVRCGCVSTA